MKKNYEIIIGEIDKIHKKRKELNRREEFLINFLEWCKKHVENFSSILLPISKF